MKSSLRKLTSAVLCVALGAAAYLALPTVRRLMWGDNRPAPTLQGLGDGPLAQVEVEGGTGDNAGNVVLAECLVALDRRASLRVDVLQSGAIEGQMVETSGVYLQQGHGEFCKFSLLLQGRIGSAKSRIWQVQDDRYLFTDIAWDDMTKTSPTGGVVPHPGRRRVSRIDLLQVRQKLEAAQPRANTTPGRATAELIRPGAWTGQGGLPMLLGALNENFDFATPRQMTFRNEPVYALIGSWKPDRLNHLLTPAAKPGVAAPTSAIAPPERMPDHVLVAIGARDLFPRLVEYRSQSDPLSAPSLSTDARFQESQMPLMRIDLLSVRFDQPISNEYFVYRKPEGVDFRDITDEREQLVENRTKQTTLLR